MGRGVPGYVTPKVAVGAAVGNDQGSSCSSSGPTQGCGCTRPGGADVGYSAAEVVVKEVQEETGIEAEPVRLIAVLDGLRLGFTRVPLYSLVFSLPGGGRQARAPSARVPPTWAGSRPTPCPSPLVGAERWGAHVFAALRGEHLDVLYDRARQPMWRGPTEPD